MVFIDALIYWSHVTLLSNRNVAYAKLRAQIIHMLAHYPNHLIKSVRLDNDEEFTSMTTICLLE